jgi:two-component system, response regulator, stage 0 sporulation protein F
MSKLIKILYVDDEPLNLQLFSYMFKKNCEVITANSGNEGLNFLDQDIDISLIISDMKMPEMNGLEFIKTARKKFNNKFFCILTGYDISDAIYDALVNKLIDRYFKKPINKSEIEEIIMAISNNNL